MTAPTFDQPLFDAHVHPEGLTRADWESLRIFGVKGVLVTAHHAPNPSTAKAILGHFDALMEKHLPLIEASGIHAYAALGAHPQALPRRGLDEVLGALPGYFSHRRVIALGEVGLHLGTGAEEEALREQLELAKRLNLPVLVHTPSLNKEPLTRITLQLLKESALKPSRVLVDHANGRTLRVILGCGHYAGLTLHPNETRAERAVQLIRKLGGKRVVLNTDIGDGAGDLLALPRAASLMLRAKLSSQLISRVLHRNAIEFLRLSTGP